MEPGRQQSTAGSGEQFAAAHMHSAPPRAPSAMRTQTKLAQPSHNPYHVLPLLTRPTTVAPTLPSSPTVFDPNTGQSTPNPWAVDLSKRPSISQPVTSSRSRVRSKASRAPPPRLAYQPYPPNWHIALGPPPLMPESQGLMPQPQPQRQIPQPQPQYLAYQAKAGVAGYLRDAPTQFPMAGYIQSQPATDVTHMHNMPMQSAPTETAQKAKFTQAMKQSRAVPIKNEQGEVVKFDAAGNKDRQLHPHRPLPSIRSDFLDDDESPIPQDFQLGRTNRKKDFTAKDETIKERRERDLAAAKEAFDNKLMEKALEHAIAARQQTFVELQAARKEAAILERMEAMDREADQQLVQQGGTIQEERDDEEAVGGGEEVGGGPGPAVVTEAQPTIAGLARELKDLREVMTMMAEQMLSMEEQIDGFARTHE